MMPSEKIMPLLIMLALYLVGVSASAEPLVLKSGVPLYDLQPVIKWEAPSEPDALAPYLVQLPQQSIHVNGDPSAVPLAALQLYFTLINQTSYHSWWIEVGTAKQRYNFLDTGQESPLIDRANRYLISFYKRILSEGSVAASIQLSPGERRTFALILPPDLEQLPEIKLWSLTELTRRPNQQTLLLIYMMLGVMFGVGIFSLFSAHILKEVEHLYFGLFLFSALYYQLSYSGNLLHLFPQLNPDLALKGSAIGGSLAMVFCAAFTRNMLQTARYTRFWHRALGGMMPLNLLIVGVTLFVEHKIAGTLALFSSVMMSMVCLGAAFVVWWKGYIVARFYLLAALVLAGGLMLSSLSLFDLIPLPFEYTYVLVGLFFTIPIFAITFADRYKALHEEKEQLQLMALQAEKQMVVRLEDQVEKRTRQLREAKEQAESASRAKGNFLNLMSHELRTPLTTVLGVTQLMDQNDQSSENSRLLKTLRSSANHLLALISDLFDLSRVEEMGVSLNRRPFNLSELLEELVERFIPLAEEQGIVLKYRAASLPPQLVGDPLRLQQILNNLIGNALKYSHGEWIRLQVEVSDAQHNSHQLRFSIADNGVGIPHEMLQKIFLPFEQGEAPVDQQHEGLGLGLALCKQLVDAMGGGIGVESSGEKGSCFWFTLNLEQAVEIAPEQRLSVPIQPLHILLADDHDTNRMIISRLLERDGHRVDGVADGEQAVEQVMHSGIHYDLVLMDVRMPRMDGLEATRQLRRHFDGEQLPIIALTADTTPETEKRCDQVGMNHFISKPFLLEELYAVLNLNVSASPEHASDCSDEFQEQASSPLMDQQLYQSYLEHFTAEELERLYHVQQQSIKQENHALQQAWQARALREVSDVAHRMASVASQAGYRALAEMALQLELLARAKDEEQLASMMPQYRVLLADSLEQEVIRS